jgi:hypothetical protein
MTFPIQNTIYTFSDIASLDLPDSPSLLFIYKNKECIIHRSHVTDQELINIPGMKNSRWCYEKTTHEDIPIFWYSDDTIDIQTIIDIKKNNYGNYSATPKGFIKK